MEMKHPEECIQCGTCVSVCPIEKVGGRAIVTFLADPNASEYSVWLCSSCWRCQESCPVGVDIYGLMMRERRKQQAPPGYQSAYDILRASGVSVAITQETLDDMRAAWDLEPVSLPALDQAERLLHPGA